MQIRKTIKRHVSDEVMADLTSGALLSDEQYAKMVALLRGAGLPEDLYSAVYSRHLRARQGAQEALLDNRRGSVPLEAPAVHLGGALMDEDSGFFEAGNDDLMQDVLGPLHADNHAGDHLGGSPDGSGAPSNPSDQEEEDEFYDAPQGAVGDDLEYFYREDSPDGSPEPALALEDPLPAAVGDPGDPLLPRDDLELDAPLDELFSDHSSDHGPDGEEPGPQRDLHADRPADVVPEDLDEDLFELDVNDPEYVHAEDLFEPGAVDHDPPAPDKLPAAFQEDALIRRAYVQAFIAHAFHGATHGAVEHMLKSEKSNLASLSKRLDYDFPGLQTMAVTLRTVEHRLAVDPNQYITYFFLCDHCWMRHHSSRLYELLHKGCTQPGCDGILYTTKTLASGKKRRRPTKPFPTSSLELNIQRMLMRPGKVDELNAWRQAGDDMAGVKPPITEQNWPGTEDVDFRMCDVYDGWGWDAIQAGLQRRRGGMWGIEDVDVHELGQRFVGLPLGIVVMINIDWFRGLKRGKYSVGAIYATLCNNPRSKRFLREETILLAVIPGPEEPSLEHLNNILEPFVAEAAKMYRGVNMSVPAQLERMPTHVYINVMAADLPGSRKATGLRSHTSKRFMRYLKYAFRARYKDQETRDVISERRGVRWSALNLLPDWFPSRDGPPDFMHAAYLGEAKHVVQGILFASGMFTKRGKDDKPLEKLQSFFDNLWWPGSAGRVPSGLITGGTGKADEWRNTCAVLPVALYQAWQVNGRVLDTKAPKLKPAEKAGTNYERIEQLLTARRHEHAAYNGDLPGDRPEGEDRMKRSYLKHYEAVLEWLVALRIFGSRSISVREAQRANACHSWACQAWARLHCHLTPYFHILSHLIIWIYRLGPVYGWWTYPYERFNGYLSRITHNGHPGELEATMMRSWNLGDDQTSEDRASIEDLQHCLQGKGKGNERGTLLTMLASMSAQRTNDAIEFPKQSQKINLKREGLYAIVFTYLRRIWADKVELIPDTSGRDVPGSAFVGRVVPSFSHAVVAGLRYGASTTHRGQCHQYAYIEGRQAVRIMHILQILHKDRRNQPLVANLAIVQPFIASDYAQSMPWATRATDLGIGTWKGGRLGAPLVVDLKLFTGHFALAMVPCRTKLLWISMSLCHDGEEPDLVDNDDDEVSFGDEVLPPGWLGVRTPLWQGHVALVSSRTSNPHLACRVRQAFKTFTAFPFIVCQRVDGTGTGDDLLVLRNIGRGVLPLQQVRVARLKQFGELIQYRRDISTGLCLLGTM
ncbi:hypothetical protein C2E23DRAFT_861486 [Lenzites betulinus]|nr:hypothetical protein C2E23DRAFT_861486 [Lenzites betulinus]